MTCGSHYTLLYLNMHIVSNPQCWFSSVFLVPLVSETLSVLRIQGTHRQVNFSFLSWVYLLGLCCRRRCQQNMLVLNLSLKTKLFSYLLSLMLRFHWPTLIQHVWTCHLSILLTVWNPHEHVHSSSTELLMATRTIGNQLFVVRAVVWWAQCTNSLKDLRLFFVFSLSNLSDLKPSVSLSLKDFIQKR